MRQRGRKSSASLTVVPMPAGSQRPDPPACLTKAQADEWQKFTLPTLVNSGISVTMHGHGLLPFVHHLWMAQNRPQA